MLYAKFCTCYLQLHPLGLFPRIDFLKRHKGVRSPRVAGFILVFVARHRVNCKNKTKVATVSKYLGLLINDAISRNTNSVYEIKERDAIVVLKSFFPRERTREKSYSRQRVGKLRLW